MLHDHQSQLLHLLVQREALRFGDFTLKSGRKSPYFINTGCFHFGGDLAALGACYAAVIRAPHGDDVDIIFGPAYKGIPLALATAQAYEQLVGRGLDGPMTTKEIKDHGDGGAFVGAPLTNDAKVVLVDDVLTAGTAIKESITKLNPCDIALAGCVISVDRREKVEGLDVSARQRLQDELNIPIDAIIGIREAVAHLAPLIDIDGVRYLNGEDVARIKEHLGDN